MVAMLQIDTVCANVKSNAYAYRHGHGHDTDSDNDDGIIYFKTKRSARSPPSDTKSKAEDEATLELTPDSTTSTHTSPYTYTDTSSGNSLAPDMRNRFSPPALPGPLPAQRISRRIYFGSGSGHDSYSSCNPFHSGSSSGSSSISIDETSLYSHKGDMYDHHHHGNHDDTKEWQPIQKNWHGRDLSKYYISPEQDKQARIDPDDIFRRVSTLKNNGANARPSLAPNNYQYKFAQVQRKIRTQACAAMDYLEQLPFMRADAVKPLAPFSGFSIPTA